MLTGYKEQCQYVRGYKLLVSKAVQPVGGAELDFIRAKAYIIMKPSFTKTIKKSYFLRLKRHFFHEKIFLLPFLRF